ncbi:MAG TPA: hypothetical protein PKO41_09620, partial [Dokdonella sp.]|nr:hypothetical protein [Dokdonella sp.]
PTISRIEERMSIEEFRAAGLDRLAPEQLEYLNRWLGSKGVEAAALPIRQRDGKVDYYPDESAREIVESRIVGTFSGWSGRTIVTLENGQKWQQSESGSRGDVNMRNPIVIVKPMSMGSWLMIVKGCNCSVRVKRVG